MLCLHTLLSLIDQEFSPYQSSPPTAGLELESSGYPSPGCALESRMEEGLGGDAGVGRGPALSGCWEGPEVGAGWRPWPLSCWSEDPQVPTSSL